MQLLIPARDACFWHQTVGCNYLSLPKIPASGTSLLIYSDPIKYAHQYIVYPMYNISHEIYTWIYSQSHKTSTSLYTVYAIDVHTFFLSQTFVWWALYILFKIVKSLIRHLGLAIGNVRHVGWFSWTLWICSLGTKWDVTPVNSNQHQCEIYW